ncbi:hypothetical protein AB6A23_01245 [Paenibacillus tarimensis]
MRKSVWMSGSILIIAVGLLSYFYQDELTDRKSDRPVRHTIVPYINENGISQVSAVVDGKIAFYDGSSWQPLFWTGVNLGTSTPGHFPGDLSPTREDYLRWFEQMVEMNVKVIRIYTILPPYFYEALAEFNAWQETPLMIFHGIWSPEEELIGEDSSGRDAYSEEITAIFRNEIRDAVGAVHGKITIPHKPGHASGEYTTDISPYVLGWIIGTEWFPYAVEVTDRKHGGMPAYTGTYFRGSDSASPFENWLARMLDTLAEEDMKYGWQRPVAFTNWLTTDPMTHPNEPLEQEDLVSVDPMNIVTQPEWYAGYFAAYHVYPYYPDFLRFEEKYLTYKDRHGEINPYAGYLNDLRAHHRGIPLIVAEFGVPSSRGIAHFGPLNRNQGMHNEDEQGRMNADLLRSIYDERLDGALLFEWHDEWFKFTWNTFDLEAPSSQRAQWRNRLTNEEHFGVISVEPSPWNGELIRIDGERDDWDYKNNHDTLQADEFILNINHDESDLYLLIEKKSGDWDTPNESIYIGFDTINGGARFNDAAAGIRFPTGIETLLIIEGDEARMLINSAYDQHTWTYGVSNRLIDIDPAYADDSAGRMLPWKLPTDLGFYLPETQVTVPFHDVEVGRMIKGISDPKDPAFNNLSDWHVRGNRIEIRIPWMLLGFTDPGTRLVWDYLYRAGGFKPVPTEGVRIMPVYLSGARPSSVVEAAHQHLYQWESWTEPAYHERKKKSFYILRDAFASYTEPLEAEPSDGRN